MNQRRLRRCPVSVLLAPPNQRDKDRREGEPSIGEPVLIANRVFLVRDLRHDTIADKSLESLGQDGTCDAQIITEVVKATYSSECCPHDQNRPAISNDPEGSVDCFGSVPCGHVLIVGQRPRVLFQNSLGVLFGPWTKCLWLRRVVVTLNSTID